MTTLTAPRLLDHRADFPGLVTASGEPWHYLDSAATAQKPKAVIDAIAQSYGRDYATGHRGVYARSADMTIAYENARRKAAAFIGGREDEAVFLRGATEGINLVASSWGGKNLKPGDRILLSQLEHHSNIVPWQLVAERTGAVIDVAPLTEDGQIDLEAVEAMLTPAHKLYGPAGIGVLWGRAALLDAMPPWQGGGAMIDRVTFERTTYAPPPQRFEAGTPHITGAIGLAAAIDYVQAIGVEAIHAPECALVAEAQDALSGINAIRLFGPQDSAGILSFEMQGVHPHDIGTILDEANVAIRAGHHCAQPLMDHLGVPATARASFGIYSNSEDVAALVRGLERVRRIFG